MNNIVAKIKNNLMLTAQEVCDIIYEEVDEIEIIEEEEYEHGRWNASMGTIFKLNNKYYCIYWYKALTEIQEDYFDEQVAQEVKQVKKMIEVTEWEFI